MPTIFPVGTMTDVASATLEIAKRVKDGVVLEDTALLGNQVFGICGVVSDKVLGSPEAIVPVGAAPMTYDTAIAQLELFAAGEEPKTGMMVSFATIQAIIAVLRFVAPRLPEPYATIVKGLLSLLG